MTPLIPEDCDLLDECRARSVELLRANSVSAGVLACTAGPEAAARNYTSIFGRDMAICALGMVASGEADLVDTARRGLLTLAAHQAPNGQIPKFVKPELQEADFWYAGCIDATLWWLVAVRFFDANVPDSALGAELAPAVSRALAWLGAQEHQRLHLLQQNEASDWADIMPRSGFVLYSNALWYRVKELYGLPGLRDTRHFFNYLFFPASRDIADERRARVLVHYIRQRRQRREPVYLSFVNFSSWGEEVDSFGNLLALLYGLAGHSRAARIADALMALEIHRPYPVRAVAIPIRPADPLWRPYMARHRQNYPHQYHNGGVWPFIGAFWAQLLGRLGKRRLAWSELARVARACQAGGWAFHEWLHGETGEPRGMAGQSWNAAAFLLAHRELRDGRGLRGAPRPARSPAAAP